MVVEHNQRSTWRHPLREPRDAALGGRCGETMELEDREITGAPLESCDIETEFLGHSGSPTRSIGRM